MSTLLGWASSATLASTFPITLTTAPTPGRRVVLAIYYSQTAAPPSVTSAGGTWTVHGSQTNVGSPIPSPPTMVVAIASCVPTTAFTVGTVITVNFPASSTHKAVYCYEPSMELDTTTAVDVSYGERANLTTAISGGPVTATVPGYYFGVTAWDSTGPDITLSEPGWTLLTTGSISGGSPVRVKKVGVTERLLGAAGAITHDATLSAAADWVEVGVVFRNAGAGGGGGPGGSGGSLVSRWVGIPTSTTVRIQTKTTGTTGASTRLAVDRTADVSSPEIYSSYLAADADGYEAHDVVGLLPDTTYYYKVEVGGSLDGNIGQFTTAPTEGSIKSFTFAFASCSNDSTTTAFDNAVNFGPRFFLHTGDFHYADITDTSQSTKRVAMENKISGNAGLKTMLAKLPTAYIWSDHDSGNNDNTGSQTYRATYQSMYRQVVPNAKLVDGSGIYHSFVYGRIRFIMCDTRSFTSPATDTDNSSKTLLGTTQKTWVKDRLADPEPVKILVVDQPWIGTGSNDDKWWSYSTERTELANYIEKIGAKVLILHGDAHELSADDGTNNKYDTGNNYPIPQVCAAPMGQNASHKGGPYSQGVYPSNTNVTHQYGRMTITDSGAYIKLVFSGRDASNAEQVALTVNWHLPNRGVGVATGIGSGTAPSPPNPTFSLSPSTITVPASVQFTDTTSPTPVSWLWDFKDGTSSTAQFPAHTYTVAGTYNPRLTVVGANGLSAFVEHTLTANNPAGPTAPVASFTPSNTSVNQGVTVAFTNTSTGTSPTWAWTFGQGEGSSTAQNPTHLYNTPGSYTVTLTATNGAGTSSASTVINVTVPGPVGSALMYRPPGYPAYAGYQIVDITQANRKPALNATVDYIIRLPQTPIGWVNGVEISGGRNIVMIGGEFNMTKDWATSGNDEGKSNRALYFTSTGGSGNRTIHVEGIHIAGNWAFEGININLTSAADQSGTTMNFVNHRHDICRSNRGTVAPPHYGGDVMQIFIGTGPKTLNIDHLTVGVSDYQAFWWQSQDAAQVRNLSNININGNGAGGPNPSNGTVPTTATDLWTGHTILLNEDSATLNVSNVFVYAPVRSVGQTITNQSGNQFTPKIGNGVTFSSSVKHADFVTTNDCGLGYRSPGYL